MMAPVRQQLSCDIDGIQVIIKIFNFGTNLIYIVDFKIFI